MCYVMGNTILYNAGIGYSSLKSVLQAEVSFMYLIPFCKMYGFFPQHFLT